MKSFGGGALAAEPSNHRCLLKPGHPIPSPPEIAMKKHHVMNNHEPLCHDMKKHHGMENHEPTCHGKKPMPWTNHEPTCHDMKNMINMYMKWKIPMAWKIMNQHVMEKHHAMNKSWNNMSWHENKPPWHVKWWTNMSWIRTAMENHDLTCHEKNHHVMDKYEPACYEMWV